jgi:transcriptional regulator with XRE-family HTH domain
VSDAGGKPTSAYRFSDGRAVLAANLRRLRAERGLSQESLADRAGIHRTYLGSVERAQRNVAIDNICRLAAALDVDVRELFAPVRMPLHGYSPTGRRARVLKVSEVTKPPRGGRRGRHRD